MTDVDHHLASLLHEILRYLYRLDRKVDALVLGQGTLITQGEHAMATLAELEAQVDANTTVEGSALTLIQGIHQQLVDLIAAGADPVVLQGMADKLKASADALAAAVAANT